jgi:hypothetical protein
MKISNKEIRDLVREAVKEHIKENKLNESSDFSAKRQIIHAAAQTVMNFENEIVKLLNIKSPDELHPTLQQSYLDIAEELKHTVISAVAEAVKKFSLLPRNDDGKGQGK